LEKDLILIKDSISPEDKNLISLLHSINGTDILLLKHRLPSDDVLMQIKNPYIKTGMHEANGPFYDEVFNIILDSEPNKYVRIRDNVFPGSENIFLTEKKLILLHDCLHHESAAKTDTSWLNKEQKDIVEFLAKQTDNLFKEYIDKVTELRKLLLGS